MNRQVEKLFKNSGLNFELGYDGVNFQLGTCIGKMNNYNSLSGNGFFTLDKNGDNYNCFNVKFEIDGDTVISTLEDSIAPVKIPFSKFVDVVSHWTKEGIETAKFFNLNTVNYSLMNSN